MRRRWAAGVGQLVRSTEANPRARIFRDCSATTIKRGLTGATLTASERSGKQLAFLFGESGWLALHLGMTGSLHVEEANFHALKHDHLVLRTDTFSLVFRDPRMFGALRFSPGKTRPDWWRDRPPEIVDRRFTLAALRLFLERRKRTSIKAVLLMQERFPGVGNWMADEILWRAGINPHRKAGSLNDSECKALHEALRFVCRGALRTVVLEKDNHWGDPPSTWLFHQRWADGGKCPRTGMQLRREKVGGRTTCWSPSVQH